MEVSGNLAILEKKEAFDQAKPLIKEKNSVKYNICTLYTNLLSNNFTENCRRRKPIIIRINRNRIAKGKIIL